jgi:hypothetical protein
LRGNRQQAIAANREQQKKWLLAIGYCLLSVVCCLLVSTQTLRGCLIGEGQLYKDISPPCLLAYGYWLLSIGYCLLAIAARLAFFFGHAAVAAVRRNSPSVVVKTTKMPRNHPAALKNHHPLAATPVPVYPRALSLALYDLQCCLRLLRPLHLLSQKRFFF